MKIGIVAPSPSPFVVGGAEKLWWGLAGHLNAHTSHPTELLKLPSPEYDLPSLVASYEQFARLDVSAFDLVITGKYPAWMVAHPRHVCYMLHRLRGLYDAYPGSTHLPRETATAPRVASLRAYMERNTGQRSALPEFFERTREVLAHGTALPGLLDFPGPFARDIVRWLDRVALAPAAIEQFAAISRTVAQRNDYFPLDAQVHVVFPPPHSSRRPGTSYDYFFTAGRLDTPKRIDLLIAAMRHVRADVPLLIAGTGPDEARLKAAAAGDPRIRFVGFQSDRELETLYEGALAVPFAPYDEDYGLIVIEAMQAAKAVVTSEDAGGPCELVVDGETGFVCTAEPAAIGAALDRLAHDRELAKSLGAAGRRRAEAVTWEAVCAVLVPDEGAQRHAPRERRAPRKLVVATTFGIYPPRHGGQSRVFHFYGNLFPDYETTIVSFCHADGEPFDREIAPGLREVRIAKSAEHEDREQQLAQAVGIPVTDVAMPELLALTPNYAEALAREAVDAHAVIACHPFLYPVLKDLAAPLWYEAQDLEWKLKEHVLAGTPTSERLLAGVRSVEGDCARAAHVILCASASDAADLATIYGVDPTRIIVAPNGTDCSRVTYTNAADRVAAKAQMGLSDQRFALFIGSGHWPNIEAVGRIIALAAEVPDVVFVVVGSVCEAFPPPPRRSNLLFLGEVDDVTRNLVLEFCDVAINPMEHGSGTSLKILDFFAAGIPVISTLLGARGVDVADGRECRIVEIDAFGFALRELLDTDAVVRDAMTRAARALVETRFDWAVIARQAASKFPESAARE